MLNYTVTGFKKWRNLVDDHIPLPNIRLDGSKTNFEVVKVDIHGKGSHLKF